MGHISCFSCVLYEALPITSVKWKNRCDIKKNPQDLSKCKTTRNTFVLNRMMQGCGMSSANERGCRIFLLSPLPPQERSHKSFTLRNPFSSHDLVQDGGTYISNALGISHYCTHHSVLISPLITTWHTEVLFALRHFRTGVGTILMIWYTINWTRQFGYEVMDRIGTDNVQYHFCGTRTNKIEGRHGWVVTCNLAQKKCVARIFNYTNLAGKFGH